MFMSEARYFKPVLTSTEGLALALLIAKDKRDLAQARRQDFEWGGALRILKFFKSPTPNGQICGAPEVQVGR